VTERIKAPKFTQLFTNVCILSQFGRGAVE